MGLLLFIPQNLRMLFAGLCAFLLAYLISACQPPTPSCPIDSVTYLPVDNFTQVNRDQEPSDPAQQVVEINGQEVLVDQVIEGMLCSGRWKGTVYVPCQVQIFAWEEDPLFLENCELSIAPGTVVYVAAHNDEPYYQGCSCHTGEITQ
jgi:hypothetical protein